MARLPRLLSSSYRPVSCPSCYDFAKQTFEPVPDEDEYTTSRFIYLFLLQVVYAGITLYRWGDRVRSHAGLGVGGVLLVMVTIAAGLGLSALTGLTFNASSTQLVPFLALGLGVDALFLLIHTFSLQTSTNISCKVNIIYICRALGPSAFSFSLCLFSPSPIRFLD